MDDDFKNGDIIWARVNRCLYIKGRVIIQCQRLVRGRTLGGLILVYFLSYLLLNSTSTTLALSILVFLAALWAIIAQATPGLKMT